MFPQKLSGRRSIAPRLTNMLLTVCSTRCLLDVKEGKDGGDVEIADMCKKGQGSGGRERLKRDERIWTREPMLYR